MANAANLHERYEPNPMWLFIANSTIRSTTSFVDWVANATAIILDVHMRP
jgi:hypothetical protein